MSDTFYLSPCCGNEHYTNINKRGENDKYICMDCDNVFDPEEIIISHFEYGLEEEIERTAYMMEG